MKNKKRIITSVLACALAGAMTIGGTMAYITSRDAKTNTFKVAKGEITLTEPKWDAKNPNGTASGLIPNASVDKDPTIKTDSEIPLIVFMKVSVPKQTFTKVNDDGTSAGDVTEELLTLKTSTSDKTTTFNTAGGWVKLSDADSADGKTHDYILGYTKIMSKNGNATSAPAFNYATLKNVVEGYSGTPSGTYKTLSTDDSFSVPVKAYSIQAQYLPGITVNENSSTDDKDWTIDKDNLVKAYDMAVGLK